MHLNNFAPIYVCTPRPPVHHTFVSSSCTCLFLFGVASQFQHSGMGSGVSQFQHLDPFGCVIFGFIEQGRRDLRLYAGDTPLLAMPSWESPVSGSPPAFSGPCRHQGPLRRSVDPIVRLPATLQLCIGQASGSTSALSGPHRRTSRHSPTSPLNRWVHVC